MPLCVFRWRGHTVAAAAQPHEGWLRLEWRENRKRRPTNDTIVVSTTRWSCRNVSERAEGGSRSAGEGQNQTALDQAERSHEEALEGEHRKADRARVLPEVGDQEAAHSRPGKIPGYQQADGPA